MFCTQQSNLPRRHPIDQLAAHISVLPPTASLLFQKVGKEKQTENEEQNEKLDEDNQPQRPPQLHAAEAVAIELPDVQEKMFHNPRS